MITLIKSLWNWIAGDGRHGRPIRWWWKDHGEAMMWWGYALAGCLTFGYNASTYPTIERETDRDYFGGYEKVTETCGRDNTETTMKSGVAGAAWPAYWAWTIMDTKEPDQC